MARTGDPIRILAGPVGAVTEWSDVVWTRERAEARGRRRRAATEADDEQKHIVMRLEAPATPVRVPAGMFLATHVVRTDTLGDTTTRWDSYYAPGVGLVAEETFDGSTRIRMELLQFQAGRDLTPARENLVRMMLPAASVWSGSGPAVIDWSDSAESLLFGGRFALIRNGTARHCAAVGTDWAMPIAPDRAGDWQALLRRWPQAGSIDAELLASLAARLHAFRCGLVDVRPEPVPTSTLAARAGDHSAIAEVSGRQDGVRRRIAVLATIDKAIEIQVDTDAKPPK
jgi:hypothetical protein